MSLRVSGHLLVRLSYGALCLWLVIWLGILANAPPGVRLVWLTGSLLPLAILAPFLLRGARAALAWAGFLSLAYFAQGVAVALANRSGAAYGALEIFLSILLFFSASAALRELRGAV
jgi:uncharacterized membrane protein